MNVSAGVSARADGASATFVKRSIARDDARERRRHSPSVSIDRVGNDSQRLEIIDLQLSFDRVYVTLRQKHFRAQHLGLVGREYRYDTSAVRACGEHEHAGRTPHDSPLCDPYHLSSARRALTRRLINATGNGLSSGHCTVPVDIL